MEQNHIKRVPVMYRDEVVGIVTRTDLLRALINGAKPRSCRRPMTRLFAGSCSRTWLSRGGLRSGLLMSWYAMELSRFQASSPTKGNAEPDVLRQKIFRGVKKVEDQLAWLVPGTGVMVGPSHNHGLRKIMMRAKDQNSRLPIPHDAMIFVAMAKKRYSCGTRAMRSVRMHVMTGVSMLRKRSYVDPKLTAVTGWSYGGYMTSWLISNYPEEWQAAMAGAPVTSWEDQYNYGDGSITVRYLFGGSPWTDGRIQAYRTSRPSPSRRRSRLPPSSCPAWKTFGFHRPSLHAVSRHEGQWSGDRVHRVQRKDPRLRRPGQLERAGSSLGGLGEAAFSGLTLGSVGRERTGGTARRLA